MSFDIFLERFSASPLGDAEDRTVRSIVDPLIASRGDGWVHIVTDGAAADVYGYGDAIQALMINHAAGDEVWDVIYRIADAGGFAVMPAGCGTLLTPRFDRHSLPDGAPEPVLEVQSGPEILAAIERA